MQDSLHDHPVGYAIWVIGSLFALVVGRTPARVAGLALVTNVLVSLLWTPDERRTVFWHLLIEDTAVLVVLVLLLQRFAKTWLLWAVAIQTIAVVAHLPRLFDPSIRNLGYAWFEAALGYLLVAALVTGAYSERRRHVPREPSR